VEERVTKWSRCHRTGHIPSQNLSLTPPPQQVVTSQGLLNCTDSKFKILCHFVIICYIQCMYTKCLFPSEKTNKDMFKNYVAFLLSTLIGFKMLRNTFQESSFNLTPNSIKELHRLNSFLSKNVYTWNI
jgi:hypothetical protein